MGEARKKGGNNKVSATSTKKTSTRGKTSKNTITKDTETHTDTSFFRAEVIMICTFAVAVFLFCSNFKLCGVIGNFFRQFQLGLFGGMGFLFPVLLVVGICFYVSNRGNMRAVLKILGCTFCFLAICGLLQMLFGGGRVEDQGIFEYYMVSGDKGKGGGLIGGLLVVSLGSMLGTLGTYLFLIVLLLIGIVFLTEKSIVNFIRNNGFKAYTYAKQDVDRRIEEYEVQREEKRKIREEQQVVSGVNLQATKLREIPLIRQNSVIPFPQREQSEEKQEEKSQKESRSSRKKGKEVKLEEKESKEIKENQEIQLEEMVSEPDSTGDRIESETLYQEESDRTDEKDLELEAEKRIDFDAVERQVRSAKFRQQSEESSLQTADVEKPVRRADVFTGRINFPKQPTSVDELRDVDVERILAMQEEEKQRRTADREEQGYDRDMDADTAKGRPSFMYEPKRIVSEEAPMTYSVFDTPMKKGKVSLPVWSTSEEKTLLSDTEDVYSKRTQGERQERAWETQREEEKSTSDYFLDSLDDTPDDSFYQADHIFVPEGTRTIVTASGKRIEAETNLLQKKLEEKRAPAVTGLDTAVQIPGRQRIMPKEGVQTASSAYYDPYDDGSTRRKKEFLPRKDEFETSAPMGPTLREQIQKQEAQIPKEYVFPPETLLTQGSFQNAERSEQEYKETAIKLQQTLQNFGVGVTVTDISCGPSVTRYELHPEQGVKVSRIVSLQDDIKLSLAAADIRIEAPIPGKSAVGIEVPNKENSVVRLRDIIHSEEFKKHPSRLAFAVGKDISGKTVVTDIAKMPHLLIAGATGSGKSVCINTLIMSILYKSSPEDVKLIMVDPKVVELSVYNGIPHLLIPVVTDPKKASAALNWAVAEMTDRYKKFADYSVRDLKGYNAKIESIAEIEDDTKPKKLPQIVIIVDELADLMMVAPGEVEDSICRLAQLARAAGIHLVIATQRPSVNVITGLIKANVPSRIAFAVSSGTDSRTIIDMNGAEKLLGKGDMLFYPSGIPKPIRVQGAFVSDNEVTSVVEFLSEQGMRADYSTEIEAKMAGGGMDAGFGDSSNERDAYFAQAGRFVIEKEKGSIGMLQRAFKIGFNRAARIMDQLADAGVVGEEEGTKPRKVLMTIEEFEDMIL